MNFCFASISHLAYKGYFNLDLEKDEKNVVRQQKQKDLKIATVNASIIALMTSLVRI